ncbi:hypothetical protein [Streptomyces diastaticus]|uniref:hypothetical protein n=1 Tax=Streptomyces diastaticus TaxID=1956 RepID=UPI0035D7C7D0
MDLDDFDETAHGPWEGGLKRLGRRASRGRREGARRDERGHRGRHEGLPGDLAGADRAGGRRGRGEGPHELGTGRAPPRPVRSARWFDRRA